ncbi:MAG: hypothetical protein ACI94Y_004032, partial [Maribacter sp.]
MNTTTTPFTSKRAQTFNSFLTKVIFSGILLLSGFALTANNLSKTKAFGENTLSDANEYSIIVISGITVEDENVCGSMDGSLSISHDGPNAKAKLIECVPAVPAAIDLTAVDNCDGNITVSPTEVITSDTTLLASPTVNLGILESFEGYTGAGAITNGAGATWIGDAGTNFGTISGDTIQGNVYVADSITARSRFDLMRLYIHLNDLFVDYPATHAPAFGVGETITPGVYSIPAAGSIGGALTLDGGGDPNAFFVIKFYGAMTVGAGATINLINGTQSCNVFYIADGAISVAASANIKGTLFAKVGAVGLGAGAFLEGRMLSMEGAIVVGVGVSVSPPPGTCTIPIFCESGCSPAPAVDVLGVLSDYALYTNFGAVPNTSTSGINGKIGTNSGTVSGFESSIVIGDIHTADASTAQANIDIDNAYIALMDLPNTDSSHAAVFGSVVPGGETINAGVYFINGAGSLGGTLVLDAQNDPDAIFVFKFAGAFSVAAQAKMILISGARRCNVFFIGGAGVATGAISIGAGATLKGTFLSHSGACGSGASLFLAGRQLSTGGAVNTYSGIIYNNPECITSTAVGATVAPVILAVAETFTAINGTTGGSTVTVLTSDELNGSPVNPTDVT